MICHGVAGHVVLICAGFHLQVWFAIRAFARAATTWCVTHIGGLQIRQQLESAGLDPVCTTDLRTRLKELKDKLKEDEQAERGKENVGKADKAGKCALAC